MNLSSIPRYNPYGKGASQPHRQTHLRPEDLPWVWPLPRLKGRTRRNGDIAGLTIDQHLDLCNEGDVARVQAELLRCKRYPEYFLLTHCFTKDEHDADDPVKRFPRKRYLKYVIQELHANQLVAIPKSRQIMITWTVLCYLLHMALFNRYRLIFLQSKKEDDAVALIDRVKHTYTYLPWWIQAAAPLRKKMPQMPYNKLQFANGSNMWGIPQGPDILRQHTASAILADEAAFQAKHEDSYKAAKPTIDGGGKYIVVSSANGKNFFYRVCYDLIDGAA